MNLRSCLILVSLAGSAMLVSGCRSKGELIVDESVGVAAVRTACPAVGIPEHTGDITLFRDASSTSAANMDVVAAITNVRSQCGDDARKAKAIRKSGERVYSTSSFDVLARRMDTRGSRRVSLPYYVTVLRGGSAVVSKRVATVTLEFADGQERARATGSASAYIDRSEATLPEDVRRRITRKRRGGDQDAAIDPLAEPEVKAAVLRATFEVLVGFQLDEKQLAYNLTR